MLRFGENAKAVRPVHPAGVADPNWADAGTQVTPQQLNEIVDILRALNTVFSAGYVPGDTGGTTLANAILSRIVAEAQTSAASLVDSAPDLLNTINELAASLDDDPNFATTMANALAAKLALAGGTMTGDLTLAGDPDAALKAATKQYVDGAVGGGANSGVQPALLADHINLEIANDGTNPTYQLDVSADQISVYNGTSGRKVYTSYSGTVDITTSGANGLDTGTEANSTWYYVWLIAKDDDTKALLLSTSSTAPTMPAEYTHKGLLGVIYNDSSGDFISISQIDYQVSRAEETILSGGSATSWTSLAPTIPANARAIWGYMLIIPTTASARYLKIAPDSTGLGEQRIGGNEATSGYGRAAPYRIPVITSQTVYYSVSGSSVTGYIYLYGWEY